MSCAGPAAAITSPTPDRPVAADQDRRLSPEELLAGADLEYDVRVPAELIRPGLGAADAPSTSVAGTVRLRPLRMRDVQLISKAAKDDDVLISALMIQRALVEPRLEQADIARMPGGLVTFLVDRINAVSGLSSSDTELREFARAPLVQAFFVLAREFGWTPEEIRELTVGQVLGYVEMLNQTGSGGG